MKTHFLIIFMYCGLSFPGTACVAQSQGLSSYGLALPQESVLLRANVETQVSKVLVREGQRVKKGDLLVKLVGDMAQSKMKIAKLQAEETGPRLNAAAELKFAQTEFQKVSGLYDQQAISDREFAEAQLRLESAEAQSIVEIEKHAAHEARFELAQAELGQYFLRAPFDGEVAQVFVNQGTTLDSNTDVLELINADNLRVEMYLPLDVAQNLQAGQTWNLIIHEPFSGKILPANVIFRSPMIEATTGTLRIVFEVDNRTLRLPAGFTVGLADQSLGKAVAVVNASE